MFPTLWDMGTDSTQVLLAASDDGRNWHPSPGGPVLSTADFGCWDGGCVFAVPNLVELPNGDFALPYSGYDVPHKYPRGRLFAVEAPEVGEFTTVAFMAPGSRLQVNAVAARAGSVRVEALDLDGRPIPGRSLGEAVPLFGDLFRAPATWQKHADLGVSPGAPVMLRICLDHAALYALDFI